MIQEQFDKSMELGEKLAEIATYWQQRALAAEDLIKTWENLWDNTMESLKPNKN